MPPSSVELVQVDSDDAARYEQENVHSVYEEIAPHFSQTRYKPWPVVQRFLESLPVGSIGLDSGTGNGKYLPIPADRPGHIITIGLDRSVGLLKFAQCAGNRAQEVLLGDAMQLAWRRRVFDYAISIATVHHLATAERRQKAIEVLLHSVSASHGRILIYVWAVDQDNTSKRSIPTDAQSESDGVDAHVPWVLSKFEAADPSRPAKVYQRYYHFFAKGELSLLAKHAATSCGLSFGKSDDFHDAPKGARGVELIQEGYEKSNLYIELKLWTV